jgi:hypothetical protein
MIWENTKLLLRLYYRPVSAMSTIIDQGHWLYAAVVVAGLSVLMQFALTSPVYWNYESVYRQVEQPRADQSEHSGARVTPLTPAMAQVEYDTSDYETRMPQGTYDRLPLPVLGHYGWWFLSFAPGSFFTTLMGLAVLYVPCLILLATMSASVGSFSVVLRRDYGPFLTCTLMAWAAAHLPFVVAGVALMSFGFGPKTALLLLGLSALCFAWLMSFGVRMLFGVGFKKALGLVCVAAFSFSIQAKLFGTVSPYLFSPFLLYYAYNLFR